MKSIRTGVISLALSSVILNATAAELCATAQDLTAMQVAAVQQKLMVAALSCNDSALYNDFVAAYQPDLLASDFALQAFFMRLNADTGASDYDAYKTKLANSYSVTSSKNTRGYCVSARTTFKTALAANRPTLRTFALAQPMTVDRRYGVCGETVAGGELHMGAVTPVIAAAENPANSAAEVAITAAANVASARAGEVAVTAAANVASAKAAESAAAAAQAPAVTASNRDDNRYRYPNGSAPQQQPARRYDARDPRDPYARPYYQQGYGDNYGYTNRYGERDPYYRNPYARPYYGRARPVPPDYYYYLRRR